MSSPTKPSSAGRRASRGSCGIPLVWSFWILTAVASAANGQSTETQGTGASDVTTAVAGGALEAVLFYLVGGATVLSALGVCISRNIVRMAVWLFVTLGSVALLYFMLAANFVGAVQLIVYAGGTLVLLIFGVMLTSKSPWVKFECGKGELVAASLVCVTLLLSLSLILSQSAFSGVEEVVPGASVAAIGTRLLTTYVVPFEVAGVLLMIVMVGAAHLARQEES